MSGEVQEHVAEGSFEGSQVRLSYATLGDGPPITLLHGGSSSWTEVAGVGFPLASEWRVYLPDMRGHGKSGWVPGHYDIDDFALDIVEFLGGVVQERSVLYGHSLGGHVALFVAASRPELVRALILADVPLDRARLKQRLAAARPMLAAWRALAASGQPVAWIANALRDAPVVDESGRVLGATDYLGTESPWFDSMARWLTSLDPTQLDAVIEFDRMHAVLDANSLLSRVRCPVLFIQADPALGGVVESEITEARRANKAVEHVTLSGQHHWLERPDEVVRAITPFLERVR